MEMVEMVAMANVVVTAKAEIGRPETAPVRPNVTGPRQEIEATFPMVVQAAMMVLGIVRILDAKAEAAHKTEVVAAVIGVQKKVYTIVSGAAHRNYPKSLRFLREEDTKYHTLSFFLGERYELFFRVPESSQLRGSEKTTANQIARVLLSEVVIDFLGPEFVFDGISLGWSAQSPPLMPVGEKKITILSLGARRNGRPNEVEVGVRNTGPVNIAALAVYLQRGGGDLNPTASPELEDALKMIAAVYRKDPQQRMFTRSNSNAYFPKEQLDVWRLGQGVLEARKGIYQSLQIRFANLTLNTDLCTGAFWVPNQNLVDIICKILGVQNRHDLEKEFLANTSSFFTACGKLLGMYFEIRHLIERKKMRFTSWSAKDAETTIFDERLPDDTTKATSVATYYERKYKTRLQFPRLPLVKTKMFGEFPLELCFTGDEDMYKGSLDSQEIADMLKSAAVKGRIRRRQVREAAKILAWHRLSIPKAFGLSCSTEMMQVKGLVLPAPTIGYGNGIVAQDRGGWTGTWNLRGKRLYKPSSIKSWALIYLSEGPMIDERLLTQLSIDIRRGFEAVGMAVPSEPVVHISNYGNPILKSIDEVIIKVTRQFGHEPGVIFFVQQQPSIQRYSMIKQAMDARRGIPSQVMVLNKALKGGKQYIANIAMKVNPKLGQGGMNHRAHEPLFDQGKGWMLLGGDTSFASPAALRQVPPPPSTAALTATWDRECTRYTAVSSLQEPTLQLIKNFSTMAQALIDRYKERNQGLLPERVIYYRDGVSESEIQMILDHEVSALRKLCRISKVSAYLAIKRHRTRFFPSNDEAVMPGTVVDNLSKELDCYMVCQAHLQGTQVPTRYMQIFDENQLGHDAFYRITNGLCSSYARATRAVALAPPVYYAHQSCERARLMLADNEDKTQTLLDVHPKLRWSMYWL